jgi:anti-sigma factor RsiW
MEPSYPDRDAPTDLPLWSSYAAGIDEPGSCPDPIELAAYLDGRCDERQLVTVETHLAACGTCLAAVRDARELALSADRPDVPASVLDAARELVQPAPRPHRESAVVLPSLWPLARWGLAAAASIAVCVAGYLIGTGTSRADRHAGELTADLTFGVIGSSDEDDDLDLVMLALAMQEEPR